jgi:hypothetical protein
VGWLRGAMNDRVEPVRLEELENAFAISDVQLVMRKVLRRSQQTIAIPSRVALLSKKNRPHVVIDTHNLVTVLVEKRNRLRSDQTA